MSNAAFQLFTPTQPNVDGVVNNYKLSLGVYGAVRLLTVRQAQPPEIPTLWVTRLNTNRPITLDCDLAWFCEAPETWVLIMQVGPSTPLLPGMYRLWLGDTKLPERFLEVEDHPGLYQRAESPLMGSFMVSPSQTCILLPGVQDGPPLVAVTERFTNQPFRGTWNTENRDGGWYVCLSARQHDVYVYWLNGLRSGSSP